MTRRRSPRLRRARSSLAVAGVALLVAVVASSCGGSDQSPAEARRDRVEDRLRSTFSGAQSACILERADADLLRALDRSRDLSPDAAALATWSDVLVACVTDPDGTTTTSTRPTAPSTTAEPGGLDPGVPSTTR